jgi:ATP-binding cassette subfamily B protein
VNAILMLVCTFIVYGKLESAGMYSALLRVVDQSVDKVQEIFNTPVMDEKGRDIRAESANIEGKNVSFSYDTRKIIDDVSFAIPERTTTAIVGPSGGGKTTLTSLIARFWDVDSGTITLDGRDVRDYTLDSLLNNYSMVFQNVYLFNDTIENNIKFGTPGATRAQVEEAAKKACCHDFIQALPDGYDTVIGEGGATISGGEKQRVSIARAMLKDAPVIILDEATANVDPENEKHLLDAIRALTRDKTIIMIAHRLKTVRHASQILVVDGGRIVQRGTHAQLMAEGGLYRDFVDMREKSIGWKLGA